MSNVSVEMPEALDPRLKAWAKLLTGMDMHAPGGYMFQGDFITLGRTVTLPVGGYVLIYGELEEAGKREPRVTIHKVLGTGQLEYIAFARGKHWAAQLAPGALNLFGDDDELRKQENAGGDLILHAVVLVTNNEHLTLCGIEAILPNKRAAEQFAERCNELLDHGQESSIKYIVQSGKFLKEAR